MLSWSSGRGCSWDCSPLDGICIPGICHAATEWIRLQRLLRIALFPDPVELNEGATRDRSPQYQAENLTLHSMYVCGEMMEFWSCGTFSQFLSNCGLKVNILRFGKRWFGTSLYPPARMSHTSMVAWIGDSIILLVWNHQRKENY